MQVINLDKITTRRDKVIILDGVEHAMRVPTVKDYIEQMKKTEQLTALSEAKPTIETATKLLELTVETLMRSFPTISKEQFESLDMDQLNRIRMLAEGFTEEDVEPSGEADGKTS